MMRPLIDGVISPVWKTACLPGLIPKLPNRTHRSSPVSYKKAGFSPLLVLSVFVSHLPSLPTWLAPRLCYPILNANMCNFISPTLPLVIKYDPLSISVSCTMMVDRQIDSYIYTPNTFRKFINLTIIKYLWNKLRNIPKVVVSILPTDVWCRSHWAGVYSGVDFRHWLDVGLSRAGELPAGIGQNSSSNTIW